MTRIQTEEIWDIEAPRSGFTGWPTLTKTNTGELLIAYSGGRPHHVCPFGQVHLISSCDEGKSWTWPRVLVDGPLDDRDAGVVQTRTGTLIVNWFSSLTWEYEMVNLPERYQRFPQKEQEEWLRRHARLTDEVRQQELGAWTIRSTDGGASWSGKTPSVVGSAHGPCELSDGRLLYVGNKTVNHFTEGEVYGPYSNECGAAESLDDGQSWQLIGDILPMPGHDSGKYYELHAVQAANGDVIVHIRNQNAEYFNEILQTESSDGGRTWSTPHPIGLWGCPAFLLRASDGRLITTVGHRREPHGNQISVSEDHGQSWSPAMPINTDSAGDFGYPSTVELSPGRFLSLWYDHLNSEVAHLRLARWQLG